MRSSIIHHTADIFDPDLLIVDKEPLGLRGEVRPTLDLLRDRGTPLILGLRDVMDDPLALENEWERKNAVPSLSDYYDEMWVYGLPLICDPLAGLDLPASVRRRMVYTGYLRRQIGSGAANPDARGLVDGDFLLVTAGGGGDGDEAIDWVLAAYEHDPGPLPPALIVFGPFMLPERQAAYDARAARLPKVRAITFDTRLEVLMARARGVVAMGGYNTFCEILSFDKPALILPRTAPRLEQYIRAQRAAELGIGCDPLRRQRARPGEDGGGADAADPAGAALVSGHSGTARRHGERQSARPEMAFARPPPAFRPPGAGHRMSGGAPVRGAGSPLSSKAIRACRRPLSPRRSRRWSSAGSTSCIVSLRHPTDKAIHPVHRQIRAERLYLPEYLYQEPLRVLRGWRGARGACRATPQPVAPGSPICAATRPRTASAALARRWCWPRSCRRTSAGCTRISSTPRPR